MIRLSVVKVRPEAPIDFGELAYIVSQGNITATSATAGLSYYKEKQ